MPYMEDLAHDVLMDAVMHDDPGLERDYYAEVDGYLDDLEARYALTSDTDEPGDGHLEADYEDRYPDPSPEDYEPSPYDGTYSEE